MLLILVNLSYDYKSAGIKCKINNIYPYFCKIKKKKKRRRLLKAD